MTTNTKVKRLRDWRDCEPSRWRGFLFTLRKRPGLAVRWVLRRYVCAPVVRVCRAVKRGVSRGLDWLAEVVPPTRAAARAQRAWGRVELAQQFKRKGGVA